MAAANLPHGGGSGLRAGALPPTNPSHPCPTMGPLVSVVVVEVGVGLCTVVAVVAVVAVVDLALAVVAAAAVAAVEAVTLAVAVMAAATPAVANGFVRCHPADALPQHATCGVVNAVRMA
jgi:hypothetical protein